MLFAQRPVCVTFFRFKFLKSSDLVTIFNILRSFSSMTVMNVRPIELWFAGLCWGGCLFFFVLGLGVFFFFFGGVCFVCLVWCVLCGLFVCVFFLKCGCFFFFSGWGWLLGCFFFFFVFFFFGGVVVCWVLLGDVLRSFLSPIFFSLPVAAHKAWLFLPWGFALFS